MACNKLSKSDRHLIENSTTKITSYGLFAELTAPDKRRPARKGRKQPARGRAQKRPTTGDEPTATEVVGTTILRLGRRIIGEPQLAKSSPSTRKIVPKPTALARQLKMVCTNCGTA